MLTNVTAHATSPARPIQPDSRTQPPLPAARKPRGDPNLALATHYGARTRVGYPPATRLPSEAKSAAECSAGAAPARAPRRTCPACARSAPRAALRRRGPHPGIAISSPTSAACGLPSTRNTTAPDAARAGRPARQLRAGARSATLADRRLEPRGDAGRGNRPLRPGSAPLPPPGRPGGTRRTRSPAQRPTLHRNAQNPRAPEPPPTGGRASRHAAATPHAAAATALYHRPSRPRHAARSQAVWQQLMHQWQPAGIPTSPSPATRQHRKQHGNTHAPEAARGAPPTHHSPANWHHPKQRDDTPCTRTNPPAAPAHHSPATRRHPRQRGNTPCTRTKPPAAPTHHSPATWRHPRQRGNTPCTRTKPAATPAHHSPAAWRHPKQRDDTPCTRSKPPAVRARPRPAIRNARKQRGNTPYT